MVLWQLSMDTAVSLGVTADTHENSFIRPVMGWAGKQSSFSYAIPASRWALSRGCAISAKRVLAQRTRGALHVIPH